MLKTLFASGALLAAAASVSGVDFTSAGVSVSGKPVTEATLQLREARGGTVLASKDKVESLAGVVEVTLGGGRTIELEPGVRLVRAGDAWEVSAHGSRRVELTYADGSVIVASPARVAATDGGWLLADGSRLAGMGLRAALATDLGVRRVAEKEAVVKEPVVDENLFSPEEQAERKKAKEADKLDTRRIVSDDLMPGAEAADEKALKRLPRVSPAG
ncbi:MAG: hypothetical protein FD180_4955 [Planctomycetota bacterium]|nr:MAG: hypothetical protein FD180_4955 [Planctomycetota bacterium]